MRVASLCLSLAVTPRLFSVTELCVSDGWQAVEEGVPEAGAGAAGGGSGGSRRRLTTAQDHLFAEARDGRVASLDAALAAAGTGGGGGGGGGGEDESAALRSDD